MIVIIASAVLTDDMCQGLAATYARLNLVLLGQHLDDNLRHLWDLADKP
ncbi:MAG: hypothetical protein JW753_01890 [Dehalococcoidia bacterium]|nr:hypothetical protein [Dehalococcoidia bacterium]